MKEFLKECNSYKGRWNRKKYWLYPIGIWLVFVMPPYILLTISLGMQNDMLMYIWWILTAISYIYLLYVSICAYIKRFHDLGKSGWFSLFMFVPFINVIFVIWTYFFRWTPGINQYGPDPLGWTAPAAVPVASKTTKEL